VAGIAAWVICSALLALTIACQRPRWNWVRSLKYHDVAALIPAWTFFAPTPGIKDTRVLWRDCFVDGAMSPWRELLPPATGCLRFLWNPQKRQNKLITDAAQMILQMAVRDPESPLTLVSLPYLLLLNRVMSLPSSPLVIARQFVVVETRLLGVDSKDLFPLFATRWHSFSSPVEIPTRVGGERPPAPALITGRGEQFGCEMEESEVKESSRA
jgi:hypothetical protein